MISVNGRTISDIQEHEKIKEKAKAPSVPEQSAADTVPTLNELFDDYFRRNSHSHFQEKDINTWLRSPVADSRANRSVSFRTKKEKGSSDHEEDYHLHQAQKVR